MFLYLICLVQLTVASTSPLEFIASEFTPWEGDRCYSGTFWNGSACELCSTPSKYCPDDSYTNGELDCPAGYYCPPRNAEKLCSCVAVGVQPGDNPCQAMHSVTGNWNCNADGTGECSTPEDINIAIRWLGNDDGSCPATNPTCGKRNNLIIDAVVNFDPIQNPHIRTQEDQAGIFITGQQARPIREHLIGSAVVLSPEDGTVRIKAFSDTYLHYTWEEVSTYIPTGEDQKITVFLSDRAYVYLNGDLYFGSDRQYYVGSVGLYARRQGVTYKRVEVHQLDCIIPCPVGTASSVVGASDSTTCQDCSLIDPGPGNYIQCDAPGTVIAIQQCRAGRYCEGGNGAKETKCSGNLVTLTAGATSQTECSTCPAGAIVEDGLLLACPLGHYCEGGDTGATPCPEGTYRDTEGAGRVEDCSPCTPGYYGCNRSGVSNPIECNIGFYCPGNYEQPPGFDRSTCYCNLALEECIDPAYYYNINSSPILNEDGDKIVDYQFFAEQPKFEIVWTGSSEWNRQYGCFNPISCSLTDYTVAADITLQPYSPTYYSSVGVAIRMSNASPGEGIVLSLNYNPQAIYLEGWRDGTYSSIGSVDYTLEYGVEYSLKLVAIGNEFFGYVNDVLVIQETEDTHVVGAPGIWIGSQGFSVRNWRMAGSDTDVPCAMEGNVQIACPPGSYQDELGKANCKPCKIGTDGCDVFHLEEPAICPSGFQCNGGTELREECAIGSFGDGSTCTQCPPGKFGNTTQAADCYSCEPGTVTTIAGERACTTCPPGSYSNVNGTECTPCPMNTFVKEFGSTSIQACQSCPTNRYASAGSSTCESCSADFYNYTITECLENNTRVIHYYTENAQCQLYAPPNPEYQTDAPCAFVPAASTAGFVVISIHMICTLIISVVLVFLIILRNSSLIRAGQFELSLILVSGCALCNILYLAMLGENTNGKCIFTGGIYHFVLIGTISCLIARIQRVYTVFKSITGKNMMKRKTESPYSTLLKLCAAGFILVTIKLAANTPRAYELEIEYQMLDAYCKAPNCVKPTEMVCTSAIELAGGFDLVYYVDLFIVVVMLASCYYAYMARKLPSYFAEAKLLMFVIYNITIVCSLFAGVHFLLDVSPTSKVLIWSCVVAWCTTSTTLILFLPKFYLIRKFTDSELRERLMQQIKVLTSSNKTDLSLPAGSTSGMRDHSSSDFVETSNYVSYSKDYVTKESVA